MSRTENVQEKGDTVATLNFFQKVNKKATGESRFDIWYVNKSYDTLYEQNWKSWPLQKQSANVSYMTQVQKSIRMQSGYYTDTIVAQLAILLKLQKNVIHFTH